MQQARLLAGQEQVHFELVALVGRLQAAPFLVVHHQPALRPGVGNGLGGAGAPGGLPGAVRRDRLVQRGREVVAAEVVGDELRQLLDQRRLEVQKRCVGRHDAARGDGVHVVVLDHPPHVDAGHAGAIPVRQLTVRRFAERKQDTVAAAEPRLEHGAATAPELLDPHPGVPQAFLQEFQLLAQALLRAGVQGRHVGAHRVVQEQYVVAWHGSKSGGPAPGARPANHPTTAARRGSGS